VESTTAELAATIEDFRDVRVLLYAQVASNYIDVRTQQHRLEPARANARAQQDTLELTQDRFDADTLGEGDVVQQRYVKLGPRQTDGTIVVLEGLEAGTRTIVEGLLRARPGLPVTPKTTTEGS
jgi:hypothetical protein